MAGLGLTNALHQYQRGMAINQQQQDRERQLSEQQRMKQEQEAQRQRDQMASQAVAKVMDTSKAEWAMNGAHGDWKPNDSTMLRAAEARGKVYAQAGDWDNYLKNETAIQGQRVRLRSSALQRYEADGDPEALLRAVYPTVFDGQGIQSVEKTMSKDGKPVLKVMFDNADKPTEIDPGQLVGMVKQSLIDPVTAAKQEIAANLQRERILAQQAKDLAVTKARGEEARATEGVKLDGRLAVVGASQDRQDGRAAADRASREKIATGNNRTALEVAGLRSVSAGKGGAGGLATIQSTKVDANGYMVGVRRDGTTERLTDTATGEPIRSSEWAKRVDAVAKQLADAPGAWDKKPEELRRQAEAMLTSGPPPERRQPAARPAAPGLSSVAPASQQRVAPQVQAKRDAEAGRQIIRDELGGDPARVQQEVTMLREGLKQAKQAGQAEAAAMLEQRLRAIEAAQQGGNASSRPGLSSFSRGQQTQSAQGQQRPPLSAFQK